MIQIKSGNIKRGLAPAFIIEVVTVGYREQWARTETKWNSGAIEWCDWKPMKIAKENLMDFLADDGFESDEISEMMREKLHGIKWGQMKAGKTLTL